MLEQSIRHKIRQLRARGLTYPEICNEVGRDIPKGTLSYICKGVALPEEYIDRQKIRLRENLNIARKKALAVNSKKLRLRLEKVQHEASKVVEPKKRALDSDKIALAMLYLGEGAKYKSYRGLSMGSSDPDILRIYIALLERCYDKQRSNFRARVQHRDDQDPEDLKAHWSRELDIPPSIFHTVTKERRTSQH